MASCAEALQGQGRHGALRRQRRRARALALSLLCAILTVAAVAWHIAAWGFVQPSLGSPGRISARSACAAGGSAPDSGSMREPIIDGMAVWRRDAVRAGALIAMLPIAPEVLAESTAATSAKLQRVVINVGDKDALAREVKFWVEACQMKVLSDKVGTDKFRSAVVGYSDAFGIEIKLDPAVLTRPNPRLLNYEVMQPTVNALNFVQVSATGKVIEIFTRVQESGGASLFGDASYVDVESPRGVAVRMVPRDVKPSVELVSFNIEVPAFEPTVLFYKRAIGMTDVAYDETEPPIQKLSAYLASATGGPNLLLCPVADGRLKERRVDEFEGVLMVSPDVKAVTASADSAVERAFKEAAQREEELRKKLAVEGKELSKVRKGTKAKPAVQFVDGAARINDGVGNMIMVAENSASDAIFA